MLASVCQAQVVDADRQKTGPKSASSGVSIRFNLSRETSAAVAAPEATGSAATGSAATGSAATGSTASGSTSQVPFAKVQFEESLELSPSSNGTGATSNTSTGKQLSLDPPSLVLPDPLDRATETQPGSDRSSLLIMPPATGVKPPTPMKLSPAKLSPAKLSRTPAPLPDNSRALRLAPTPTSNEELQASQLKTQEPWSASLKFSDQVAISLKKQSQADASNECPGSPDATAPVPVSDPDDVPLEQEEHPYDAPAAKSTAAPPTISNQSNERLTARDRQIQLGIQQCLQYYLEHPENTTRRGPWALMHAALPFGVESQVIAGGRTVNTIGWMSFNGVCAKQRLFQPTRQGFRTNVGPGVQGHEGQFLAILAQSSVSGDYPLQIGSRRYTVMDLARYEMSTCREQSELTFKLIGLSHYLEPNQRWRDSRGHTWSLEKMVAEELTQPINGAACGGTHRLMGLSYAIIQRQSTGQPITGHWNRAERFLNDYINYTMSLQNPDGSFSTNWFESRGMDADVERKVQTTGHILEWLVYTLPDEHLRSPKIQLGIEFLLSTVGREAERDWPIGPRGHALRTMAVYSQRVFGAEAGQMKSYVAQVPSARQQR